MGSITPPELLVVDFTKGLKPGSPAWSSACNDIRRGLEYHGCFIAIYDKISPELDKSIFKAADELFDLPLELKIKNVNEKPYHGYVGQISFVPLHEGLGIDYSTTEEGVDSFINIMWPQGNKSFRETSFAFAKTVAKLDEMVIRMLFESYGAEKHSESHIDSSTYLLRYLKYRAPEMNETSMAFPSHTDKSFLTILYQNHVSGLEIKTRDGVWMNVNFPPKSFVVMAGDACQVLFSISLNHYI
ncbi:OLC1v1014680C1 [Oldenlandia corymbosa var. corymbosa]|uniref:OLC1v1014680C1 n=1 Tax=Oldenlandia corymbosa var. corymbosa TaxID=529605 RepID=A0AAV1E3P9_OLDCO|nr:OLC1v1014680C1 [Oldenlandia corymbosa var. corymbosa]